MPLGAGAVVADGRCGDERLGPSVRDGFGEQPCGVDAARPQRLFLMDAPAPGEHVLSSKMNHRVACANGRPDGVGLPRDVSGRTAADDHDIVTRALEPSLEPATDETRAPGK